MKITAFDGSPRKNSNSSAILKAFTDKARILGAEVNIYRTNQLDIKECRGCLICNSLKKCSIRGDGWIEIADEIIAADVLVFATPIYFHHAVSSMKKLLDRFRSFIHVTITEDGIIHRPHTAWNKKLFLFTAHGSSSEEDAHPLNDLFDFIRRSMGEENSLKIITGTRLAMPGQILAERNQLTEIYKKLGLPELLVETDLAANRALINTAERYAEELFD